MADDPIGPILLLFNHNDETIELPKHSPKEMADISEIEHDNKLDIYIIQIQLIPIKTMKI